MNDTYQTITNQMIAELEKGNIPWHCPWRPSEWSRRNLISGKTYRGINTFLLGMTPYQSPFWLTARQISRLGGTLKPGACGTGIIFWTLYEKDEATKLPVLRLYHVFNLEQTLGIPEKHIPRLSSWENVGFSPIEAAEEIIAGYANCPPIIHAGDSAGYSPSLDRIKMPGRIQFESEEEFYCTLFHELIHSTGHQSRLNRTDLKSGRFGDEPYAREELIAEMGAAFLCARSGIGHATNKNSGAYIRNWLMQLRNDKKLVIQAAQKAQKAVDYILAPAAEQENAA